jgi:hypothetical protein
MRRVVVLCAIMVACSRREEAKPAPESTPAAPPIAEHNVASLTCRDGVLGAPSAEMPPPSVDGGVAPLSDAGALGGLGVFGTLGGGTLGAGRHVVYPIVGVPFETRGPRALAVAKGVCGAIDAIRDCHSASLRQTGAMDLELSVARTGKVIVVKHTGGEVTDADLATCVAEALTHRTFEPAAVGLTRYRLTFEQRTATGSASAETPATTGGDLAPEIVARIVRRNAPKMKACYEKALLTQPSLNGKIIVKFTIDEKGNVEDVKDGGSTIADATMKSCVRRIYEGMVFPAPKGGKVTVTFPMTFTS